MPNQINAFLLQQPIMGAEGWHSHAASAVNGIAATAGLLVNQTFTQLAAEDTITVVSSDANDTTQICRVYGIDNQGNRRWENISLNGTTRVSSTVTWRYIENYFLSAECAGTVTIERDNTPTFTDIGTIVIGQLQAYTAQHFSGECDSYITYWSCGLADNATDSVTFELRWYPDDADCLDPTDGYLVLDTQVALAMTVNSNQAVSQPVPLHYAQAIKCPAGGWIAVYALGGAASCEGYTTLQGFDIDKSAIGR